MKHETQVDTLKTLLELRERGRDQEMLNEVVELPVDNYTDPNVLDRELETVFQSYPMIAGHTCHVREPGDYLLSDWDRFPFVVVRGNDGVLRGFLNTCRHRGAKIVSGDEDTLKAFVCPFHNWAYDLEGCLFSVPQEYGFPDLDYSEHNLVELPVEERDGLVWIHPTPGAEMDLDAYLGPFNEDLKHFDLDELVSYRKTRVVKHANWKLLIQTYLEGYHVPYLHNSTFSKAFRNGVIAHTEHGPHIRLSAARANVKDALDVDEEAWEILEYASVYYSLFPHGFFIMHPDYVSLNLFYPEAPDRTIWTHDMLYRASDFQGEKGDAALQKRFEFTNDVVFDQEDFAIAEDVQTGLRPGANDTHTLGLQEGLLAIFQSNINEAMETATPAHASA